MDCHVCHPKTWDIGLVEINLFPDERIKKNFIAQLKRYKPEHRPDFDRANEVK